MAVTSLPRGATDAAIRLLYPPVDPYLDDPVGFAHDVLQDHPWSKQAEILESVRDHQRTSVRACHGVGKTRAAAQVALWFLGTHPNSRVITTAPTWAQVEELLWRQIRSAVARAHQAGRGQIFPVPSATKLEIGNEWLALGLSTNEPERFQGHHADHILLIVDEASGVDERIYEASEGFLTAEGAKVLLISNPTKIGGQFYRTFHEERATWHTINISVFDSPNYTGETVPTHVSRSLPHRGWAEDRARAWGEGTPMYEVRVLGEFPSTSEDTVITLAAVDAAQRRELPAAVDQHVAVIACDVARFGSDETVIVERVGQRVRIVESYVGKPTTHTAGKVAEHARRFHPHVRIVVDDTGVGGGVTDQLRAQGFEVVAFNGGETAHHPLDFPNRRSELWFQAAAQIDDLDLDGDEQLAADLTAPKYGYDLKMRRVVEKKADTKKRLGRSPDRADAVLLALVNEPGQVVVLPPPRMSGAREPDEMSDQDWMHRPL